MISDVYPRRKCSFRLLCVAVGFGG
jgi:hypothetical protein